jgi:hypothetical protein
MHHNDHTSLHPYTKPLWFLSLTQTMISKKVPISLQSTVWSSNQIYWFCLMHDWILANLNPTPCTGTCVSFLSIETQTQLTA